MQKKVNSLKILFLVLTLIFALSLVSCFETANDGTNDSTDGSTETEKPPVIGSLKIEGESSLTLEIGETCKLVIDHTADVLKFVKWSVVGDAVTVDNSGTVTAAKVGTATVKAEYGALSDTVTVTVVLPHEHNYVNGRCECGELDPAHTHTFVDDACACGEINVIKVDAARSKADGATVSTKGVVAGITYAFGQVPSGVILVDETSSIYVYDKTLAASVKVGNTIAVRGTVGHWILEEEQANAAKFGYKGSCQIENATLISNDGKITDFDKSWIEETTVKELLDIPVTENITTKLYKVTALIKEVPGNGFTNFYFFDIDGTSGTYAYSQCNGSDFTWLREFEGKLCTVYITALNAKSTSSDCYFRFLPVAVFDDGYTFNTADAPKYALKYHALDQLSKEYTGDPALSLIGSVSSELLKLDNILISYSSSDESVIKFTKQPDGSYLMNCIGYGTATVTVSASYGDFEYSETVEITVKESTEVPSITPEEAIASANDETVTVKGIVGPSFVHANRRGFYLIGKNSVIAISFANVDDMKDISIGNTVIITGVRATIKDTQICIDNAALVTNLFGSAPIPDSIFITDTPIGSIAATGNKTNLFTAKATVEFIDGAYSDTYNLSGNQLYSSNAIAQYSILEAYKDQEITAILSVVDWNGKGSKLTLVGIITEDGTVYNEYSFNMAKN